MSQRLTLAALTVVLLALAQCEEKKPIPTPAPMAEATPSPTDVAAAAAATDAARLKELTQVAVDAYVYAYPLVTMEMTRRVMTNVTQAAGTRAPMGQFAKLREYPNASFRDITAPNADTLYTVLWLDVSQEPWVVSVPDMKGRYYLMPMLDGWTTVFADPGKRTTGTKAQKFAITGPGWTGTLPPGVTQYKSATGMVWLLGRIYSSGTAKDYAEVHKLQDACTAMPLRAFGTRYQAPAGVVDAAQDMKTATREQVNQLDGVAFFTLFAKLLKTNPPTAEDAPMGAELAKLGIVAGQDLDASKLDAVTTKAMHDVPPLAQRRIMGWFHEGIAAGDAKLENGWFFTTKTGVYGTNYLQRALVTAVGLGANLPQDAIYPTSELTADGQNYNGSHQYRLHFAKGQMPPADGFWSLTMYDAQFFFVANKLNRYNVSSRSAFKKNKDGSVDLFIQKDPPAKAMMANWLPATEHDFKLMLRLYWPSEKPPSLLDGSWTIPAVTAVP